MVASQVRARALMLPARALHRDTLLLLPCQR